MASRFAVLGSCGLFTLCLGACSSSTAVFLPPDSGAGTAGVGVIAGSAGGAATPAAGTGAISAGQPGGGFGVGGVAAGAPANGGAGAAGTLGGIAGAAGQSAPAAGQPGAGTAGSSGGAGTGGGASSSAGSNAGGTGGVVAGTGGRSAGTGGTSPGGAGPSAGAGGAGGSPNSQWVLGYYVGYGIDALPIAQIDWSGITHIAFAPLLVNTDHTLDMGFTDSHGTGVADAKALSTAAHAHGVKALLMLGGAGAGPNIATAATAANRAAFVTRLLDALDTLGYDGIDLDWEDSVVLTDLVALAADLRAARPSILLSYPGGAINANYQMVAPLLVQLAQHLDRFNIQTYYPSTAWAGNGWNSWFTSPLSGMTGTTPIAIDDSLQRHVTAGIPKAKLGMGVGFYAICYSGGITGPRQSTDAGVSIIGGDNTYPLSRFFQAGGTYALSSADERKLDATASVPYLSLTAAVNDGGCGGSTRYISYEDPTSLIAKGNFSRQQGYGGIIIWTLNEGLLPAGAADGLAPNALTQALKTGFLTP